MCYLPLKAFPGNSVHLSHWSELNHIAQTAASYNGKFFFFFHQVATCLDKSKGSIAVEEKDGILVDPTKNT